MPKLTIEQTFKSNDTEETIDIYFYRPIGYRIALLCQKIGLTPNAVTIISIFFGIGAGILFYPQSITWNVLGMLLLIFANSLDSADGQLARLTDNKSRFGRILDGFAGDFWFAAIHIAICLRSMEEGWSAWIWFFGIAAGVSHVLQSAMADYYRNVHLFFIKGSTGSELDNSKDLEKDLGQTKGAFMRFVIRGYRNYTSLQERLSPNLQLLLAQLNVRYAHMGLPKHLVSDFRAMNKPLMKYTNIVQFNTRVLFLFLWLFIDQAWIYFFFDIFVLNPILFYMCKKQEKVSAYFHKAISEGKYPVQEHEAL